MVIQFRAAATRLVTPDSWCNVLYDRDERGGELLHLYTPLVAGRFYIELLERRGGYSGFGAPNTPVRLAAQAATPWL